MDKNDKELVEARELLRQAAKVYLHSYKSYINSLEEIIITPSFQDFHTALEQQVKIRNGWCVQLYSYIQFYLHEWATEKKYGFDLSISENGKSLVWPNSSDDYLADIFEKLIQTEDRIKEIVFVNFEVSTTPGDSIAMRDIFSKGLSIMRTLAIVTTASEIHKHKYEQNQ